MLWFAEDYEFTPEQAAKMAALMERIGPCGTHRGPEGPNEDLSQCPRCGFPAWSMRPEGETYGLHADDCSLPLRHTSWCVGGGSGHPRAEKVRGYFPELGIV